MVKVGLLGIGKWGKNHLRTLSQIKCDLVGISDINEEKKSLSEEYGIDFYTDYKKLLKLIDAVIVTTPTDLHFNIVKNCINAGKHVLVEKPIATTARQSKILIELAQSKNVVLSVGYLFRFNNAIIRLKELLKEVGRVQYITCRYIHSTKPPRKDSGAIFNLGIHPIDILNFISEKKPSKIFAKKSNLLSDKFEDSAIITLDYGNFFATVEASCTHPEKKRDIWVIAEKEKIYVDYFSEKITRYPIVIDYDNVRRNDPIEENINPNEPLREELQYFLNFVKKKQELNIDLKDNIGKENYYTTRACELSLESAISGEEMSLDE
jgi:UDP-N-acetylglucosamine 3-dehydrogenase